MLMKNTLFIVPSGIVLWWQQALQRK